MFNPPALGYILFFGFAVLGSIIGLLTGLLIQRTKPRTIRMALIYSLSGAVGFILGVWVSLINFSLDESLSMDGWFIGKSGFADYLFLFGVGGAIVLTIIVHLCITFATKQFRKGRLAA